MTVEQIDEDQIHCLWLDRNGGKQIGVFHASGLSQEELAHDAGVDRTYISQVERALRNITVIVLARIAKALKTMPDSF